MLYCTIMAEKHTDNTKYKHSHKKNAKREVKYLTRSSVPDTIFSNQQPATKRHKCAICTMHPEHTPFFSANNTHRTGLPSSCVFLSFENMRASALSLCKKQSSTYKKYACGCFLHAPSICSAYFQKFCQHRHGCRRMSYGLGLIQSKKQNTPKP